MRQTKPDEVDQTFWPHPKSMAFVWTDRTNEWTQWWVMTQIVGDTISSCSTGPKPLVSNRATCRVFQTEKNRHKRLDRTKSNRPGARIGWIGPKPASGWSAFCPSFQVQKNKPVSKHDEHLPSAVLLDQYEPALSHHDHQACTDAPSSEEWLCSGQIAIGNNGLMNWLIQNGQVDQTYLS